MIVLTFQPRFVPLVTAGAKTQTIRQQRKRPIRVGDWLSLRRWTGLPYRSKQEELRARTRCTYIGIVRMGTFAISVDNHALDQMDKDAFARRDGFAHHGDMVAWFQNEHGLPFEGTLIRWAP